MKHISVLFLGLAVFLLSGCFIVPSLKDPFGAYEAKVTMNDRNAQARETMARYERDARIAEAEQTTAAKVNTARAWTTMLPNVVLLFVMGAVIVVYIYWH